MEQRLGFYRIENAENEIPDQLHFPTILSVTSLLLSFSYLSSFRILAMVLSLGSTLTLSYPEAKSVVDLSRNIFSAPELEAEKVARVILRRWSSNKFLKHS